MRFFPRFVIFAVFALLTAGMLHGADVRQVQDKLKAQDFYFGEPTGVMDEETSTALRRYQIRNDLAVTGELDEATAKSLGVTGSSSAPVATSDREFLQNKVVGVEQPQSTGRSTVPSAPQMSPAERRQVLVTEFLAPSSYAAVEPTSQLEVVRWTQSRLKESGYYQSGIDGVPGEGTRRAVAAYQADHGIRPTGLLDDVTLDLMENQLVSGPARRTFEINVDVGSAGPALRGQQVFRGLRVR